MENCNQRTWFFSPVNTCESSLHYFHLLFTIGGYAFVKGSAYQVKSEDTTEAKQGQMYG